MKYYNGSELLWSTEDVQANALLLDIHLSDDEAKQILNATFKDSEYLMQLINEIITETILDYNEQQ